MEQGSTSASTSDSSEHRNYTLQPKHKVFLSHSGAQKGFVEQLWVDLKRYDRHAFLDKHRDSLPIGKDFPSLIFQAIEQCEVGVVVLSEEFFTSKWPMLELVAMKNAKERNPSFTIVPIFLGITLSQCLNRDNQNRWLSTWHDWAKSDSRIDIDDWENAMQLFRWTNALKYNPELGEVKFREEIVEEICKMVPSETRLEDSYIQGRSRSCKVIREKIKQSGVCALYEVPVVGLYGVGGIGKTTICKAMCNDLSKEYRGKVAHVELGSQSELELLKEVLRRLTNKNHQLLGAMNVDECRHHLIRDMMNAAVFLTIDNVSSATMNQALTLLRANYGPGSVVLVTTRSLDELTSLRINASQCMEMAEIEIQEAKALFLNRAACVPPNKADDELISSCVQQCFFQKGSGVSSHYHPLALQVLGEQLGCVGYVPKRWWAILNEIDIFNVFRVSLHPVFSILRRSFDALNAQDQLLFMDAAIFVPYRIGRNNFYDFGYNWNVFEWFGMIHGISVNTVIERLENLKRKSLVENLGDGFTRIGMHDLWREFARLETKVGELEKRRWMLEWDEHNVLEEARVMTGGSWGNLRRMCFHEQGFMKLEEVDFDCFPNVTVLKLSRSDSRLLQLDLSGLKHLKSLELDLGRDSMYFVTKRRLFQRSFGLGGLSSLSKLSFLRWNYVPADSRSIDEIGRLTKLQALDLLSSRRLPDLSSLVLLRVACFRFIDTAETITGLSSKHTNLCSLDIQGCKALRTCPGVGELIALQELRLRNCSKLKKVPNLQKLKRLRKLDVSCCFSLTALPGLGDLVSLLELRALLCENLVELPDLRNLINLRILDLGYCKLIKSLPGLDELVCLQSLDTENCGSLTKFPDMRKLTNLQFLVCDPDCPLQSSAGLSDLISLRMLHIGFSELRDWPDLRKLTKLETLCIAGWQVQGFSKFVLLESVTIRKCKGVRVLPDLQKLTRLYRLKFSNCEFEDISGMSNLTRLQQLCIMDCDKLEAIPDLRKLVRLKSLWVERCARLRDFRGVLSLRNLETLRACGHPWLYENMGPDLRQLTGLRFLDVSYGGFADLQAVAACSQLHEFACCGYPIQEFPDLANFPKLRKLEVCDCVNLTRVTCTGPLSADFHFLDVAGCRSLRALPDLSNARNMYMLNVTKSGVVMSPQFIMLAKSR